MYVYINVYICIYIHTHIYMQTTKSLCASEHTEIFHTLPFFFNAALFLLHCLILKSRQKSLRALAQKCHQKKETHRSMAYLKHLKITWEETLLLFPLPKRHRQHRKAVSCLTVNFCPGVRTYGARMMCPWTAIASVRLSQVRLHEGSVGRGSVVGLWSP